MPIITRRDAISAGLATACQPLLKGVGRLLEPIHVTEMQNPAPTPLYDNPFAATHARAGVLIQQLKFGLDYFGYRQNYVPILSIDQYTTDNAQLLQAGCDLQNALKVYTSVENDLIAQEQTLTLARNNASAQLVSLNAEATDISTQQGSMSQQIEQLDAAHLAARADVLQKVAALNASLQGNGCTVFQIVAIAGAIVSAVATLGTDLPVLVAAGAAALNGVAYAANGGTPTLTTPTADSLSGSISTRVKDVKVVKGQIDDMIAAYNSVQKAFPPQPVAGEIDAVKFLVEDGDFPAMRAAVEKQVANLPESKAKSDYVDSMNNYLSITQTRNQQILAFDGLSFRLSQIGNDLANATTMIGQLNDQLNADTVADKTAVIDQIKQVLEALRRRLQLQLYQETRAMDYWSLSREPAPLLADDFLIMSGSLGQLAARRDRIASAVDGPSGILSKQIVPHITLDQLSRFRSSGTLSFIIRSDDPNFVGENDVLVNGVLMDVLDNRGRSIHPMKYAVTHSGYHRFSSVTGINMDFVTKPRTIKIEVDINGGFELQQVFAIDGDARFTASLANYVGVSPFTQWTVALTDPTLISSLSKLQTVRVSLSGHAR